MDVVAAARGDNMIAKDLLPWLFVGRASAWKPFAKVRCEGGRCYWTAKAEKKAVRPRPEPRPCAA